MTLHLTHDLGEAHGDLDSASATYFPVSLMRKVSKTVTVPELTGDQREVSFPLVLTIFSPRHSLTTSHQEPIFFLSMPSPLPEPVAWTPSVADELWLGPSSSESHAQGAPIPSFAGSIRQSFWSQLRLHRSQEGSSGVSRPHP